MNPGVAVRSCRVFVYIAWRHSLAHNCRHEVGNFDLQWEGGRGRPYYSSVAPERGGLDVSGEGLGGRVPEREWGGVVAMCGGMHVV